MALELGNPKDSAEFSDIIHGRLKHLNIENVQVLLEIYYRNICGETGLDVFDTTTLKRLVALYGMDPKKLAFKGAEIISDAQGLASGSIRQYFQEVISPAEVDFLLENRPIISRNLIQSVENTIATGTIPRHPNYRFKDEIAALIIGGSYAYESFDRESDLDALYVTRGSGSILTGYFSDQLRGMSPFNPRIEEIDRPTKLRPLGRMLRQAKYLIITPYPDVRATLAR